MLQHVFGSVISVKGPGKILVRQGGTHLMKYLTQREHDYSFLLA